MVLHTGQFHAEGLGGGKHRNFRDHQGTGAPLPTTDDKSLVPSRV